MTDIPIYELKENPLRYIKAKKFLVKLLTFALFPKKFRKKAKKYFAYKLGIGEKPFSKKYQAEFEKVQQEFFKECDDIDRSKYQIISLGSSCLCRTLPTFWKLKPRKKDGEKSYPDCAFECLGKTNGWYKIRIKGHIGYVRQDLVSWAAYYAD